MAARHADELRGGDEAKGDGFTRYELVGVTSFGDDCGKVGVPGERYALRLAVTSFAWSIMLVPDYAKPLVRVWKGG